MLEFEIFIELLCTKLQVLGPLLNQTCPLKEML